MKLCLPQLLWYENTPLEMEFPDSWDIHYLPPAGYDRPKLTPDQMEQAFANPIGTPRIRELAQGKKLGQEYLERFLVFQHNPWENCVPVGTTSHGNPLAVNREVMSCDLKIGIGSILPHPQVGFGGGGKIILPGGSHVARLEHFTG